MTPQQCDSLGGDIKAIRQAALEKPYVEGVPAEKGHPIATVFQSEYALVVHLAQLPMPTIGVCEGVWMGFGMVWPLTWQPTLA